jgi:hypothetical protein
VCIVRDVGKPLKRLGLVGEGGVSTTMNCGAVPIGIARELIGVDRRDCEDG